MSLSTLDVPNAFQRQYVSAVLKANIFVQTCLINSTKNLLRTEKLENF